MDLDKHFIIPNLNRKYLSLIKSAVVRSVGLVINFLEDFFVNLQPSRSNLVESE